MKILFCILFLLSVICMPHNSNAQKVDSPYKVATWAGFRDAAVTYTFDDGCANQFAKAIPLFDEFGYKLTLFTVVNWSSENWPKLQNAAKNGHEVASHTISHIKLSGVSLDKQQIELQNSRLEIDKKITNTKCLTFAYPNCVVGDFGLVGQNYISARGCQGFIEGPTPKDMLNVSSLICGSLSALKVADNLNSKINSVLSTKGWLVFLFHGIDDDGGYSPIGSGELRKNLEYVQKMDSQVWVTTFLDATLYVRERNAVNIKEISATKNLLKVSVTDTLDNTVYTLPISIRRNLPKGWSGAVISQNGQMLSSKLIEAGTSKVVQFNAVPDAGEISIAKLGKKGDVKLNKRNSKRL